MKRLLCTTAIEETWREHEPILFLGEWCRRHSRRHRWSGLDAEVLPYHWDDRARLQADYRYLQGLHEQLLHALRDDLNRLHNVDHSLRYWRILVGPWLGYFVPMLFDRWTSIQQAIIRADISETIVLAEREGDLIPNCMAEFNRLYREDAWNHHIYATLLKNYTQVPCIARPRPEAFGTPETAAAESWRRRARRSISGWSSRIAHFLTREEDAFLLSTYLPLGAELRLQLRLGQVPQLWDSPPPAQADFISDRRRWIVSGENHSDFEACARTLIPQNIPLAYLEGYSRLIRQAAELPWPRRPKVIWTSNPQITDDVFKAWAADKVEKGSPLVIGQHGGHYGTGQWSFDEEHELAICDRYLSWGWTEPDQPKVTPVGQLKMRRPLGVRHSRQSMALLVQALHPRQSYHMYSTIVSRQWIDYFEDQCRFVSHLPAAIRDALCVRLSSADYGWDQLQRWRDRFPDIRLDEGHCDITGLIRKSRLYISTYNATTFLESLTMDVPSVIYWNPRHWELRKSAAPYFEELRRVGIFHDTPESAARHVAAIWHDVDAWWSDPSLRTVLRQFTERYCNLPTDMLDRVEEALLDLTPPADRPTVP